MVLDSLYSTISFAGQIQGLNNAIIQPRIDGFLTSIDFQGGSFVHKGDLLFTLDPGSFLTTLYAAEASVESQKANQLLTQRNYQRAIPLAKINAISQSDYDQYEASYKAARASVKAAEENLKTAQINLSYTTIYAPIDGTIAKTSASVGDYVGIGTAQSELTTISYIDTVVIDLAIPTSSYLTHSIKNSEGRYDNSVLLSDIQLFLPDSTLYAHRGEYYYTKKDTPTNSSTVVIAVKFPNPQHILKPGMFARVESNIGAYKASLVVPQRAISQQQGISSVWVVKPDSTVSLQEVSLGATYDDMWAIRQGVELGDLVLLTGQMKMRDGTKVVPEIQKQGR